MIVSDVQFEASKTRSLVIVATTRNMAYAFDAEDPIQCHPVWRVQLDRGGATPVPRSDYSSLCIDFTAEIGVTSTPVIDRSAALVYPTSKRKLVVAGKPHYLYRLHALDLKTGAERLNGPAVIAETIATFQVEGTATFSCNRFTILGSGHDIWDPSDAFHFVYQAVQNGSLTISARVVSIQDTNDWAKTGVMIRETLDADSPHAMVVITPGQGAALQVRPSKGTPSVNESFGTRVSAPFWVRLVRTASGNSFQFTGSVSRDGVSRMVVGSTNFAMATNALAGIPVTAHLDGNNNPLLRDLCVAVIDKVVLSS